MPNSIITGGYGGGSSELAYADIDWGKTSYTILFEIVKVIDVKFIKNGVNDLSFEITSNDKSFNINTQSVDFNLETHNINFNFNVCI